MIKDYDNEMNEKTPISEPEPSWTQLAQRRYDPDECRELATAVIFALAEAKGVSPTDMKSPLLYEVADVAAIEEMFFGPDIPETARQGIETVEFYFADYLVVVRSDGWIQVYDTNTPEPA